MMTFYSYCYQVVIIAISLLDSTVGTTPFVLGVWLQVPGMGQGLLHVNSFRHEASKMMTFALLKVG